jgi:hypothetical protein
MKVYESITSLSPDYVRALPREYRATDWNADSLPFPLSWCVALDPDTLWFLCSLAGGERSSSPRGEFVEGLWEDDVAELFIKSPDGTYQELNFAPSGAWWSMTLDDYRVRRTSPRRPEIRHMTTSVVGGQWSVVVGLARASMEVPLTSQSAIHVSGMWYQDEPRYLSSSPPAGIAPDYHHPGCFETVQMLSCSGWG